jgi:hypothetical protein
MVALRVLSVIAVLVMTAIIAYGFASGDFTSEGSQIWGLTWGKVTLVDLYVGLAIFAVWIGFRERRIIGTFIWWIALVILGNLAAAVYLALAAFKSSDVRELLLGRDRVTAATGRHESR